MTTMDPSTTTLSKYLVADTGQVYNDEKPIVVTSPLMVTGDWHMPLIDTELVNDMILCGRKEKIKTLAIGGDFWNFDALSQYDPKQEDHNLVQEIDRGNEVMKTLLESFDRVIYTWGNHDARLHKALGYKMPFARAMKHMFVDLSEKELDRIEFSNLDHFWVQTPIGPYYVCHPSSYSRNPLTVARKISGKIGAHVITAHSHHHAVGYAESGMHVCGELGGLFDRHKTTYLNRSSTFPTWQNGYGFIDGRGKLRLRSLYWDA